MEELSVEVLNEIIQEVVTLDCSEFSNLIESLAEVNSNLDETHHEDIVEFMIERLNVVSESEMLELSDFERESFISFLNNLY